MNLTRRPVMGVASAYQLVVGEIDDDWDYDPDTLRNTRFLTARFYLLKPGIADLRRLTEAAAIRDADNITTMATATQSNAWRELVDAARTPREALFASVEEMHALVDLLDDAVPPGQAD